MVWGVCQRVLRNSHDAEDAFQATFLVLVRKAASILPRELVGNWLYGVAYRTSMKARTMNARRRAKERDVPRAEPPPDDIWQELIPLLDRELNRLSDKYRVPVVLCELEGRSRKEVAQQLSLPEGTLSSRLAMARKMLAKRFSRYGVLVSAGALAAVLCENAASASLPTSLTTSTTKAAVVLAGSQGAVTGLVSAQVSALVKGVMKAMFLTKLKISTALVLTVGLLGSGVMLTQPAFRAEQPNGEQRIAQPNSQVSTAEKPRPEAQPDVRQGGSPKPEAQKTDTPKTDPDRLPDPFGIIEGGLPLGFLTNKSVQEDLKMTGQQVKKAVAAFQKRSEAEQHLSSLPGQPARFQKEGELSKEGYKAVKDILNADQQKRLRQITLQQVGVRALGRRPVAVEVGLSEYQQNEITALITDSRRVIRRICEDRRWLDDKEKADNGARWKLDAMVDKIEKKLNAAILAVLTSEQKTKWKEMNGKPFTGPRFIHR
jgi:RNA polymerase sigma factor (sigma-70 family)